MFFNYWPLNAVRTLHRQHVSSVACCTVRRRYRISAGSGCRPAGWWRRRLRKARDRRRTPRQRWADRQDWSFTPTATSTADRIGLGASGEISSERRAMFERSLDPPMCHSVDPARRVSAATKPEPRPSVPVHRRSTALTGLRTPARFIARSHSANQFISVLSSDEIESRRCPHPRNVDPSPFRRSAVRDYPTRMSRQGC